MLRRVAQSAARCVYERAVSAGVAARAFATEPPQIEDDPALDTRDVPGLLAQMMHDEAAKAKKQDALKADIRKIIDLLEDSSPDADSPFEGKLKDALPRMGKSSKNELFRELMSSEDMQSAQPALRNVLSQLADVNESARIVEVAYKYMELIEGKASGPEPLTIDMTVASKENNQDIEEKKAMLVQDMMNKGALSKNRKVAWNVRTDPDILGGVVYNMGDILVDCSVKSLQDEFYASLANAGIQRVE